MVIVGITAIIILTTKIYLKHKRIDFHMCVYEHTKYIF